MTPILPIRLTRWESALARFRIWRGVCPVCAFSLDACWCCTLSEAISKLSGGGTSAETKRRWQRACGLKPWFWPMLSKIRRAFKQMVCDHRDFRHKRDFHGNEIETHNWQLSEWDCGHCGKSILRAHHKAFYDAEERWTEAE